MERKGRQRKGMEGKAEGRGRKHGRALVLVRDSRDGQGGTVRNEVMEGRKGDEEKILFS